MVAATVTPLSKKSQSIFQEYLKVVYNIQKDELSQRRDRMQSIDTIYQRETDKTQAHTDAKSANAAGNTNKIQNITVPIVMPQVETAVAHQSSVFLSEQPLFSVISTPQFIEEAMSMTTVIDDQARRGNWTAEFLNMFRAGKKHNLGAIEIAWCAEKSSIIETDLEKSATEGIPTEVLWEGNKIKYLDGYNLILDTRVDPTVCYKDGEFAGYWEMMTRIKLKEFINNLPDVIIPNIRPAFESGCTTNASAGTNNTSYYQPLINPEFSADRESNYTGTNWESWAGLSEKARDKGIEYKDMYEVTTLYCRVLPSEFDLVTPNSNTPQIYKIIFVNHEHIIYCERQTNAHNWIPILVGRPTEDGTGKQSKSLAKNTEPFQYVTSALMNSVIASRRRAISDRCLYDPSRIASAQINNSNPSAKIPVRPAAYGKNISEAVYRFDYKEDQAVNSLTQIGQLIGMSNQLTGQNPATQGQFVKGNKTSDQWQDVMQNATSRDQMASLVWEAQVFAPMKHILKTNILQKQGGTILYNRDAQVAVEVDPIKLRKAILEFKLADGLITKSELVNADITSVAFQTLGSAPHIAAGYNLAPMFSYLMKTQGAQISEFEKSPEQVAYEQAMNQWLQLAQVALEKGTEFKLPQPKPADFNYNPAGQTIEGAANESE